MPAVAVKVGISLVEMEPECGVMAVLPRGPGWGSGRVPTDTETRGAVGRVCAFLGFIPPPITGTRAAGPIRPALDKISLSLLFSSLMLLNCSSDITMVAECV